MLVAVVGIREIRETVASTADKLAVAAEDTKVAVIAVAVLATVALVVGLIALGMKARTA